MAKAGFSSPRLPIATGGLQSDVPGRTDNLSLKVPDGSYVVPADVVSGMGQGNTSAGTKALDSMFKLNSSFKAGKEFTGGPWGTSAPKIKKKSGYRKRGKSAPGRPRFSFADGGLAAAGPYEGDEPDDETAIEIAAAGGEYVIPPEKVMELGGGDITEGHDILDEFVKQTRAETIEEMANLPGPARD